MIRDTLRSGPRQLAVAGSVLAVLSAFVPWFEAAGIDRTFTITPALTAYVRPSVWLLVLLTVGGAGLLIMKDVPTLLGCVGAFLLNATLLLWLFGAKTSSFIPKDVLPEGFTVQLKLGADIGLLAALLMVSGAVMVLADQTWAGRQSISTGWVVPCGLLTAIVLVTSREAAWLHLEALDFQWDLTVDVVPFLGDLLLILLLAGAVAAILGAFTPSLWIHVVGLALGVLVVGMSLIGVLAEGFIEDVAGWVTERAPFLEGRQVTVTSTAGPYVSMLAGAILLGFSVAVLAKSVGSRGASEMASSGRSAPTMRGPADPF